MSSLCPPDIFSPSCVARQRARRLVLSCGSDTPPAPNFLHPLHEEIAKRLLERVEDGGIRKKKGLVSGNLAGFLIEKLKKTGFEDIEQALAPSECTDNHSFNHNFLPRKGCFDLVISFLDLHFVNDPLDCLTAYREALSSEGLFLAVFWGGDSLAALRRTLTEAEHQKRKGISARFPPLIDLLTASHILQAAGFRDPVADREIFDFETRDLVALCRELRFLGETNPLMARPRTIPPRELFFPHPSPEKEKKTFRDKAELFYLYGRGCG